MVSVGRPTGSTAHALWRSGRVTSRTYTMMYTYFVRGANATPGSDTSSVNTGEKHDRAMSDAITEMANSRERLSTVLIGVIPR